jgi:signal transduction histidine kinase
VKEIEKAYKTINSLDSLAEEDFNNAIMEIAIQDNLQILITDEDFTTVRSTSRDAKELAARLFGYYTGFYRDKITVVEEKDYYTIQKTKDISINTSYLEMWGQLDNGKWFLIRTPIESIENAVNLSNYFYLCIGALVTSIAVISIIMLSKRITNPIVQLSGLSKRMAELDFDARYTGHVGNEIDQLGENFNKMSDTLEKTISELKTANVELQKDVELKNQIDEVRKEFLNNVSHELKTPIALISGYAEGLKENVAEDAESRDFYCDVIIDEANKMNTMVKKLLTLNQLEFGNDQTVMERFDLTALINGVISGMRLLISEKGATVSFKVSEPVYVWGDEFKIEEVVTNYMSNALNHLDYDRQIDVRIRTENGIVTTSVFNTGDPIPEEDINKIWDKFYKVDKARTREYGGSGIGLSIVKAIMDAHQQTCGVKNYANGVVFYFTLEGK